MYMLSFLTFLVIKKKKKKIPFSPVNDHKIKENILVFEQDGYEWIQNRFRQST